MDSCVYCFRKEGDNEFMNIVANEIADEVSMIFTLRPYQMKASIAYSLTELVCCFST